ncbi:MAG: NUDIX hydrolase [Phycisphaeraceae bacterium]|jgi:8-oxo-dGTP pyrophosphatase MutT (NUDIX family)|nr:NUDIX hydrolase [Phycisphaeraceae bacterium]
MHLHGRDHLDSRDRANRQRRQTKVGCACFRIDTQGVLRILLITSARGAWIIPKGTVEEGQSPEAAALQEAWEEAGVHGWIMGQTLGTWLYARADAHNNARHDAVPVLPVWIDELAKVWPEDHKRQRRWSSLREALELIQDEGLRRVLITLARRAGSGGLRAA